MLAEHITLEDNRVESVVVEAAEITLRSCPAYPEESRLFVPHQEYPGCGHIKPAPDSDNV